MRRSGPALPPSVQPTGAAKSAPAIGRSVSVLTIFPQGRVTDHRINLTLYKIDKIMNGEALDEVVDALIADDEAARLAEIA